MEKGISWKEFELLAPHLASLGHLKLNRKIAFLATLKKDGSPRLHPVTPFIGSDMLFIFTEPTSPKINDLRRDDRYALHCSMDRKEGEPLIEFSVTGRVRIVNDGVVRAEAAKIAASPVLTENYVLFEFQITQALLIEYDNNGNRTTRRWNQEEKSKRSWQDSG